MPVVAGQLLVPISVRSVQQALTQLTSRTVGVHPDAGLVGPGAIDGFWGPATFQSLSTYLFGGQINTDQDEAYYRSLEETPRHSTFVNVDSDALRELNDLAGEYLRAHPTAAVQMSQAPSSDGGAPVIVIGPNLDPQPGEMVFASPGSGSGLSLGAKIALGVLAAGAVGGIVWMATKRKRR